MEGARKRGDCPVDSAVAHATPRNATQRNALASRLLPTESACQLSVPEPLADLSARGDVSAGDGEGNGGCFARAQPVGCILGT